MRTTTVLSDADKDGDDGANAVKLAARYGEALLAALEPVDRPGSFAAAGDLPSIHPGLSVAGVGPVGLPLGDAQAAMLVQASRQAPYGKGAETLVDLDVRKVWEIDAEAVVFANPDWPDVVEQAVRETEAQLGLADHALNADLYKLLLYEEGGFFLSHQDGERTDRMVATLVIVLPTAHEGGELIVRHGTEETTIDFDEGAAFGLQYGAFYADCPHEVKPVRNGRRLCLTYNLSLTASAADIDGAPSYEDVETNAADVLTAARAEFPGAPVIIALDHEYTAAGFAAENLKGTDRTKAKVLAAAAQEAGYQPFIALFTIWEAGMAESSGGYTYWDDEPQDADDCEMGEIYNESAYVEAWSDLDGEQVALGQLPIAEEEVIVDGSLRDFQPESEFEGYTGNAGMTLEYWYRSAVVVLWPQGSQKYPDLVRRAPRFVDGLLAMEADAIVDEDHRRGVTSAAHHVLNYWGDADLPKGLRLGADFVQIIDRIPASELAKKYLDLVTRERAELTVAALPALAKASGWRNVAVTCRFTWQLGDDDQIRTRAELLRDCTETYATIPAANLIWGPVVDAAVATVTRWSLKEVASHWHRTPDDDAAVLEAIIPALWRFGSQTAAVTLLDVLRTNPPRLPRHELQIKVLGNLAKWLRAHDRDDLRPVLRTWLQDLREDLARRTAAEPQPPETWARTPAPDGCCRDCQALSSFLADPAREYEEFPLAKARRQHLHGVIEFNGLDITHVTRRVGRPYVLTCRKTSGSHKRRLARFHADLDLDKMLGKRYAWLLT